MEALKEQKRQQMALDDEDEEVSEPATKKQKTAKGQKATANGTTKADKKRKNAKGNSSDDAEEEEVKPSKKGKKSKEMKTLQGGVKSKDMADGKRRGHQRMGCGMRRNESGRKEEVDYSAETCLWTGRVTTNDWTQCHSDLHHSAQGNQWKELKMMEICKWKDIERDYV